MVDPSTRKMGTTLVLASLKTPDVDGEVVENGALTRTAGAVVGIAVGGSVQISEHV